MNSPEAIGRNRAMVTINAAMSVDIQGQVIADTIRAVQYSGIGGHEDFVSGPALDLDDRSLLCLPVHDHGRRRAPLADRPLVRGRARSSPRRATRST